MGSTATLHHALKQTKVKKKPKCTSGSVLTFTATTHTLEQLQYSERILSFAL